ncbi:Pkinase-domain-containing protein [Neocallimastix lanati (nom. inval.)]|nr:Pkinase-domain-containing protein [Neocallimastix sp. JGI-2020a]
MDPSQPYQIYPFNSIKFNPSRIPTMQMVPEHVYARTENAERKYCLNDFDRLITLGTGTFGRVFLVKRRGTNNYYAMKAMKKTEVVRLKQVEHINSEKEIISKVHHPFIVNMFCTFQDVKYLYMIMEYIIGGELFLHLRRAGNFPPPQARFYAAEVILALEYLHSLDIVYRDLKPENILIDQTGHIKITDFGFAKKVESRTWTLCGTPEYLAPEIIQSKGHGKAVDWWALGILIYEMLLGYPPFYDESPFGIYDKILQGVIMFPPYIDRVAKDLIERLLTEDITKRLGNLVGEAQDVKQHRWFKDINWQALYNKEIIPPFIPKCHAVNDTSNFERYPEPSPEEFITTESDVDTYRDLFLNF